MVAGKQEADNVSSVRIVKTTQAVISVVVFQSQLLIDIKHEVEEAFGDILPAVAEEMIRQHFTLQQSKNVCH